MRSVEIGERYGRLEVLQYSHTNKHGKTMWKCRCECGNEIIATGSHLISGHTKSCGCLKKDNATAALTTHGQRYTRLYNTWLHMRDRCCNPRAKDFEAYGGRGITVCKEWSNSFETFREWAFENGYADSLTIDRIDVNGDYEPRNCRWATVKVQANNRRTCVHIEAFGQRRTVAEWAEITGISRTTLYSRIKNGIIGELALKEVTTK